MAEPGYRPSTGRESTGARRQWRLASPVAEVYVGVPAFGNHPEGFTHMYESILLPTDGSQEMSEVVSQAIDLASLCDAALHVLHVVDERAYLSVPDDARESVRATLAADGESFTKSIAERAMEADLTVHRELRWGDPAVAILSYAVENDVDLVVMGTHGRTGYERYLLGSVAEKVVRTAPMPVLAIAVGDTDRQARAIASAGTIESDPGRASEK